MGLNNTHALGYNTRVYGAAEVTAGTIVKPASTDALKVLRCNINPAIDRVDRMDARQHRSMIERITRKSSVAWEIEKYLMPSGTAGTPPDDHLFWKALMGAYANTPATSDAYTLSSSQTLDSITLERELNSIVSDIVSGAIVEEASINISGGDEPKVKFAGFGLGHAHTGTSTLNGAMVASTTMVVQAADGNNFEVGSIVKIGSDDNGGAGFKITDDSARPSFTIDVAATASDTDPVIPFVPTETTAGSPVSLTLGSFTLDAVSVPITAMDVTIKNNIKAVADHAFATYPDDAIPGFREVTGSLSFRARKDLILELGTRKLFTARDLQVIIGNVAGDKCTIDMNQIEINFQPMEVPEAEEAMITLPFKALGSSGNDEISITFT